MAHSLQDRVSAFSKTELIPALAEACDQFVEPNQCLQIDKLEIDVGTISIDKLENGFKEGIVTEFKKQLQRMVMKNPTLINSIQKNQEKVTDPIIEIESIHLKKIDLFIYFLAHGSIPWWYSTQKLKMKEVIDELLLNSQKLFLDRLTPLLISNEIRLRLAQTFSDSQLIQLIDPNDKLELKQIWETLTNQFQVGFFKPKSLKEIKLIVFEKILLESNFGDRVSQRKKTIRKAFLQAVIVLQPKSVTDIKSVRISAKEMQDTPLLSKLIEGLNKKEVAEILNKQTSQVIIKSDKKILIPTKKQEKKIQKKIPNEDIFIEINNAGIVLFWPYLQMFFKELDLLEDRSFKDDESSWKAVHLLHFLAFGNERAEEHQWALNKILCGLNVSDFVPEDFSLSKAEKRECNNLLQAVIRNWEVLKNTSVKNLQQSFLIRNGLVKKDQQGFIIEIERITIDILLDKLNWTLSVISLPWNRGLIHVKW